MLHAWFFALFAVLSKKSWHRRSSSAARQADSDAAFQRGGVFMAAMTSPQSDASNPSASSVQSNTTSQPDTPQLESFKIKAFRPIPLTASQEAEIRDIYYRNVRAKCADQIRDFAHCATGRTFTIPFKCRQERKAMETCMIGYATRAEEDAAREEWFATVGERRRKQQEDDRWKQSQKALKREWWADYEKSRGVSRPPEADGKK